MLRILSVAAVLALAFCVGADSAFGQAYTDQGTDLDFFDTGNWNNVTGGGLPDADEANGIRWGDNNTGTVSMVYDPATNSPGNMTYGVGTIQAHDHYLGRIAGGHYTFTQESGDLTFATATSIRAFNIGHDGGGTYVMNGGKVTFEVQAGMYIGSYMGSATFDHNGGDVVVTDPDDGGLWIGYRDSTEGGNPTRTYSLGAGTLTTELLSIATDTNTGKDTSAWPSAGTLDFDAGSTGIVYVATADRPATQIETMINNGLITVGGSAAGVGDFFITEGTGAGGLYTEVKLVPEPSTVVLAGFGLLSLALWGRRRRR